MRSSDVPSRAAIILITIVVLLALTIPCFAQNLMRNGRFEGATAGDVPESWSFHDFRDDDLASGSVVRGGNVGPSCLELKAPVFPANFACYSRPIDLTAIDTGEVLVSCYFRTEEHPQAAVTLATYAEDFTRLEFQTPELQSETYHLGETKPWTLFATRLECKPGATDLVVMLRVMGGGKVQWDGVSVRPVGGQVEVGLEDVGTVTDLPAARTVSARVRNLTATELPVQLAIEVIPEKGRRRNLSARSSLAPEQADRIEVGYRLDFREAHDLRITVTGTEPDEIYDYYQRSAPGLVDAAVVEPAFRACLLSSVPGNRVLVEGRLNAVPLIAREAEISAQLVGTGARTDDLQFLSDDGLAGPWRLELPADGMLTDNYEVHLRATVGRHEHMLSLPLSRCRHTEYEVAYDAQGRLYVHGEPVLPIGLDRVTQVEDLPDVREAGFNFVITPSRSCSWLYAGAAGDAGLMFALSSTTLEGKFWQNMADKYGLHSALLGYYGLPTPDAGGATPDLLQDVYMRAGEPYPGIAQLDRHHPVLLKLRPNATIGDFARACDIVIVESEPVPRWPLTDVCDAVERAIEAVGGHKPVWAAIQSTGLAWQQASRLDPATSGRPPTPEEHRAMTFLALISGADGLVHYSWSIPYVSGSPSYHLRRDAPELWEAIKVTNLQIAWLAPVFLADSPRPLALPADCPLRMAAWRHEDVEYTVAVNPTPDIQALGFDLGAGPRQQVDVLFEERALVATEDGRVGDAFQPYEVHIYARKL